MVHLLFQTNDGDLKMMKSISNLSLSPLSLALSLSLVWVLKSEALLGFATAHRGIASHHTVRTVAAPGAPAGAERRKRRRRGEEVDSDCLKRHLREERKEKGAGQAGGAHHGLKGDYSGGLCQRQQGNHRWAPDPGWLFRGKVCF